MTTVSPKVEPGSRPQCASTRDRWLLHQGELWFVSKLNSTSGSALICFFIILTFTLTLVHCRNHEEQHSEDPEEHDGKEDVKDMEEQKTKETNEIEEDFERPQVTLKISRWMNKPTPNTRQSRISVIELKRSSVVHVFSWIFFPTRTTQMLRLPRLNLTSFTGTLLEVMMIFWKDENHKFSENSHLLGDLASAIAVTVLEENDRKLFYFFQVKFVTTLQDCSNQ